MVMTATAASTGLGMRPRIGKASNSPLVLLMELNVDGRYVAILKGMTESVIHTALGQLLIVRVAETWWSAD